MYIDVLTHVPFENAANIEFWAKLNNYQVRYCHLYANQPLPSPDSVEFLAVMGGPMNVYDYSEHPWLRQEKAFINAIIANNTPVIGVCLGAQLIADVLGAKVYPNKHKEIGFFDITKTADAKSSLISTLPDVFTAFHWHGDTFDIPVGAVHLAMSKACQNQAFQYKNNVLGLQFHIEYSAESINLMLENCSDELRQASPYIQPASEILSKLNILEQNKTLLFKVLDAFPLT